jgi:hypothetical protein
LNKKEASEIMNARKSVRMPGQWIGDIFLMVVLAAVPELVRAEAVVADQAKAKAEALEAKAEDHARPVAGETLTAGEASALDPAGTAPLDDPVTCLARTIYWEAKGEGEEGMRAVANVVLNRLGKPGFPDTVCGVVKEGQSQRKCQFSWWCDGRPDEAQDAGAYARGTSPAGRSTGKWTTRPRARCTFTGAALIRNGPRRTIGPPKSAHTCSMPRSTGRRNDALGADSFGLRGQKVKHPPGCP